MFISFSNPVEHFLAAVYSTSLVLLPFPSQADFVAWFAQDQSWKILIQLQWNSMAD